MRSAVDAVGLAATNADRRLTLNQDDRVGLDVLARLPRKAQRRPLGFGGLALADHFPRNAAFVAGSPRSTSCFNRPRVIERSS